MAALPGYRAHMSDQTYAITHVVGTSPDSVQQAIRNGVATASKSLRNLDWFEVDEIRGHLSDEGEVLHFQVTMKVGFRYE
jgi:flavin-binding protein dodecin